MKILYILLVLSTTTVIVAVLALLWRLRRHVRRPSAQAVMEMHPEQESAERS